MATHRAVALLDKPGATRTPRPAAELIAELGAELPSTPGRRARHGLSVPAPRSGVDQDRADQGLRRENPLVPVLPATLIPAQPRRRADWFTTGWSAPEVEPVVGPADRVDDTADADDTADEFRTRVSALLAELRRTADDDGTPAGAALFEPDDDREVAGAESMRPAVEQDAPGDTDTDSQDAPTAAELRAIATDRDGVRRPSAAPAGLAGATGVFEAARVGRTGRFGRIPHQGVVAAASATVLGATAAVVAATGGFTPHQATAELDTSVDQATQRIELARPAADTPVVPLASNYDSAADAAVKKVAEAADKHRADATQIIAAAHAPQRGTNAGPGGADAGGASAGGGKASVPAVTGSSRGAAALKAAMTQIGKPYVWGAAGPSAYDCSGLVMWAYKQIGVSLPHSSSAQSTMGTAVSKDQLQPGDLVFFYSPVSHVGIYAGNGMVLNASTSGQPVKMSKLSSMPFHNARRL
ncbi:NLP/P60 protein [Pseudonocardia dioxanivorans CB1190]|uniref:NLP/P60 protein n=1 Tax=Pseudonocardia dioxanivorans (strain ATCC 55486 / DSM 44775 / JCM 13855 / CB1190) TaxID=675635 RepID=F4CNL3_PSEUX|nr:NlpC/P60 family protein [Pseudonocardia dioxanivorans]AEA28311.1 NLP/P60 protein [Pseudonocardia dioxanivorans CB1190]